MRLKKQYPSYGGNPKIQNSSFDINLEYGVKVQRSRIFNWDRSVSLGPHQLVGYLYALMQYLFAFCSLPEVVADADGIIRLICEADCSR